MAFFYHFICGMKAKMPIGIQGKLPAYMSANVQIGRYANVQEIRNEYPTKLIKEELSKCR
jgi:hypothetical protein